MESKWQRPSAEQRFWEKVDRSGGPDACWPWRASYFTSGYGQFTINGKGMNAQRAAYILTRGQLMPDIVVRHSCDNKACCNPKHLLAGSQADNIRDNAERGLLRIGSLNGISRLTEDAVSEMRRLVASGEKSCYQISKETGLSRPCVQKAVRGHTWKHVPGALSRLPLRAKRAQKGEDSRNAKLTLAQVEALREAAKTRKHGFATEWARKLGVGRSTISRVVNGQTWS